LSSFIEAKAITKDFGAVRANDQVNLSIEQGEIHGLVGENGAGKSTLMKVLYGMYQPDEGELFVKGKKVEFEGPHDALEAGIGMVHQHFMLVRRMNVLENLILGAEPTENKLGWINYKEAHKQLEKLKEDIHAHLFWKDKVKRLTVGQEQRLEIIKLLYRRSDCLIFDEPTGVLTPQEVDAFLKSLFKLKQQGKTIILITHKLSEVMEVCDRITVMRQGRSIETVQKKDIDIKTLAHMLVGRDVDVLEERVARKEGGEREVVVEVKGLSRKRLKPVSFTIKKGEILGVAGVAGNGQSELADALWGSEEIDSGSIKINGKSIESLSVEKRKALGLSHIPEDRHRNGMILEMSLVENFYLGSSGHFGKKRIIPRRQIHSDLKKAIDSFEIQCTGPLAKAGSLSGGNQQKVIIARELISKPVFLIAAQPTRGVDIGAIERVHRELIRMRDQGMSILLISCELDELLALSDRLIVLRGGEISKSFDDLSGDWTQLRYQIGEAML